MTATYFFTPDKIYIVDNHEQTDMDITKVGSSIYAYKDLVVRYSITSMRWYHEVNNEGVLPEDRPYALHGSFSIVKDSNELINILRYKYPDNEKFEEVMLKAIDCMWGNTILSDTPSRKMAILPRFGHDEIMRWFYPTEEEIEFVRHHMGIILEGKNISDIRDAKYDFIKKQLAEGKDIDFDYFK